MATFVNDVNSPVKYEFINKEGKNILIEEFGRSYEKYFSVLTAIALGRTTKNEIMVTILYDNPVKSQNS